MIIFAIDRGQSKSVSCEFDTNGGDYRFKTFDTTRPLVRKLLEKSRADQVVIEICPLAATVYDIGRELGIAGGGSCPPPCRSRVIRGRGLDVANCEGS